MTIGGLQSGRCPWDSVVLSRLGHPSVPPPRFPGKTTVGLCPNRTRITRRSRRQINGRGDARSTLLCPVLCRNWLRPRQSSADFLQTCRQPSYLKMWRPPSRSRRPLSPQIGTRPVQQCMCSWLASTFTGRPCCSPVSGIKLVQHPLGLHDPSVRL
jgi:hypothetical protein